MFKVWSLFHQSIYQGIYDKKEKRRNVGAKLKKKKKGSPQERPEKRITSPRDTRGHAPGHVKQTQETRLQHVLTDLQSSLSNLLHGRSQSKGEQRLGGTAESVNVVGVLVRLLAVGVATLTGDSLAAGIVGNEETASDEERVEKHVDGRHVPPESRVLVGVLELEDGVGVGGGGGELNGDTTAVGVDFPLVDGQVATSGDGLHLTGLHVGDPDVNLLLELVGNDQTGASSRGRRAAGDHGSGGGGGWHRGGADRAGAGAGHDGEGQLFVLLHVDRAGGGGRRRRGSGGRGSGGRDGLSGRVDGDPFSDPDELTLLVLVGTLVVVAVRLSNGNGGQSGEDADRLDELHGEYVLWTSETVLSAVVEIGICLFHRRIVKD